MEEEPNLNFNDESDNESVIIDDDVEETENDEENNEGNDNDEQDEEEEEEEEKDKDSIEEVGSNENNSENENASENENNGEDPESEFNYSDNDEESHISSEDYDSEEDMYLFDEDIEENMIENSHNLLKINNMQEVKILSKVIRDNSNNVIDEHHRTLPILTKYERAKILGTRANQINSGCKAFIELSENDIDGYIIAEKELLQKKIPFIIKRPLPSGKNEYWNVNDLELIN